MVSILTAFGRTSIDDIKNKVRILPDQIKKGYPSALIIIRDDKARERILVPRCQRQRLVVKEHETMLHVESITSSVENSTGPTCSNKSKRFAKLANHTKQLKSDDNSYLLLLNKQKKRTFLFLAKHMA
jgi:hypothetical protein